MALPRVYGDAPLHTSKDKKKPQDENRCCARTYLETLAGGFFRDLSRMPFVILSDPLFVVNDICEH